MESKVCITCKQIKPLNDYFLHPSGRDNRMTRCKTCKSAINIAVKRMRNGYKSLIPKNCECCGVPREKIELDHCHETGKFRGFLCGSCNITIGKFGDNYRSLVEKGAGTMYKKYMRTAYQRMGEKR